MRAHERRPGGVRYLRGRRLHGLQHRYILGTCGGGQLRRSSTEEFEVRREVQNDDRSQRLAKLAFGQEFVRPAIVASTGSDYAGRGQGPDPLGTTSLGPVEAEPVVPPEAESDSPTDPTPFRTLDLCCPDTTRRPRQGHDNFVACRSRRSGRAKLDIYRTRLALYGPSLAKFCPGLEVGSRQNLPKYPKPVASGPIVGPAWVKVARR